jgi:replicative DNA helicase
MSYTPYIPRELEESVIGGIIMNPSHLAQIDWLEADHFGTYQGRLSFGAIRALEANGTPIDAMTIGAELERRGVNDPSFAYLGKCALNVPTASNVVAYARQIRDAALNRNVRIALTEVLSSDENSGSELLSMALAAVSRLDGDEPSDASTIKDVVLRRMKRLGEIDTERSNGGTTLTGYPTGIANLDAKIGGFQRKIVTVVAARPGMGKSSLGLAVADACSLAGFGAHVFSLEDSEEAYADRTISRLSEVPAADIRALKLQNGAMGRMNVAVGGLKSRHWLFDGRSGITADEIVRSVRKHRKANNTRVVIVDYIQLIKRPFGMSPRASTHEVLTENITTLADAAKHDDMAYVVMSQLNRELEKRQDKRPMMSDLRESGSLEERAKCVIGVYRGAYYGDAVKGVDYARKGKDENEPAPTSAEWAKSVELWVLKNNNGPTGICRATFDGPTTRMT